MTRILKQIKNQYLWLKEIIEVNLKGIMEYRTAFFMQVFGMMINNIGLIAVWFLFFNIFEDVNGWEFKEMIGLQGFVALVYGMVLSVGNGLRRISRNITYGQLDKYLLLPKNILVNLLFSESSISAIGDMLFGIISMIIYFYVAGIPITAILLMPILIITAIFIFIGFQVVTQSIAFWIPNSEELSDALFEFMLGPSLYPNASFTGLVRTFFTFFVPAILIGGAPIDVLLSNNLGIIAQMFLISIFWISFASFIFYRGLKRYESGNLVGVR